MILSEAEKNTDLTVTKVTGEPRVTKRLRELGVAPGGRLRVVRFSPLKSSVLVEVLGSLLAVRLDAARGIEVTETRAKGERE